MGWNREDFEALTIEAIDDYQKVLVSCKCGWEDYFFGGTGLTEVIEMARAHTNKCTYEGE